MKNYLFLVLVSCCLWACPQDSGSPTPEITSPVSPETGQSAKLTVNSAPESTRQDNAQKRQKKRKSNEQDDLTASTFSEAVANAVIRRLRDGLEGHSQRLMLSIFDRDKITDYSSFENQIDAFFNHYEAFRTHLRVLEATMEGEKAIVLTEIEMEAIPRGDAPPVRKQNQLRLELERGSKGWKIIEFKPRDFFS
jgi:hypothetical protein